MKLNIYHYILQQLQKAILSAWTDLQLNPVRILRGGWETYSDVLQGFLVPSLLGNVVKTIPLEKPKRHLVTTET